MLPIYNSTFIYMRTSLLPAFIVAAGCMIPMASEAKVYGDTVMIPERAIILTGDSANADHRANIAILYSREGMSFDEPGAPRFLFLDKEGKVALGIGGYVKGVGMYDFDGAIDGTGFATYDIPTPFDPSQRQRFGASAAQSTVFLKLVTRPTKFGRVIVYLQTGFNSASSGYTMKLKQAYVSVGHVTAGLARSSFADGEAQAPTIDSEGPSGQVTAKNMLFQYKTSSFKGISAAISIENPSASYSTVDGQSKAISQRFPDIPLYVQYAWNKDSHVRASFIYRRLSYRDLLTEKNHFVDGWGVHLSSVGDIVGGLGYFGHVAYGKGIARYVNDLSGNGYDLIPDAVSGELSAPGTLAYTAGLSYNFTKKFFMTASYSQARAYDCSILGGDSYRYGQYATINAFYNLTGDFQIGAECVIGRRSNYDGERGHANRMEVMMQYNF